MNAEFIAAQRTEHGVCHSVSCRALDVPESTFCKHLDRPPTPAAQRREAFDVKVRKVFEDSDSTYGSPRVRAQLRRDGLAVSKKAVEASTCLSGVVCPP